MFTKIIFLFRIFFPSWKFFDESSYLYYLKFRYSKDKEEITSMEWQFCPPKQNRKLSQFLINPAGNIALACESTVQHFYSDLFARQNADNQIPITEVTSYKNIQNLVKYFSEIIDKDFTKYQFKIAVMNENEEEDILVSIIHSREENEA